MENRILKVIDSSGLTASDFAIKVGIQSAQISHIKSGRNKVSLEIVQRILASFDNINPDWLILGKGEMYRSATISTENQHNKQENQLNKPVMKGLFDEQSYNSTEYAKENELNDEIENPIEENIPSEEISDSSVEEPVEEIQKTIPSTEENNLSQPNPNKETQNQNDDPVVNIIQASNNRSVNKIIVFYTDKTYDEFVKV